jgi:hypothetical protein
MGVPYNYNIENIYNSVVNPSTAHYIDNFTAKFYTRYFLQKAMSVFKWELPELWDKDYFLYTLYTWGFIAVLNTDKFGVIPQQCTLTGYNLFYAPKRITVTNPIMPETIERDIDKDCVLLKLTPDYAGILDLIYFYASKMALASSALNVNLLNSKLAYLFTAKNKSVAESFKKMYDQIASGEPASIIDRNLLDPDGNKTWDFFSQNLQQNYIASDILTDMRKIEQQFDTDIGIPNANTDKRERLITDEVNANNVETATRCELWLEELKKGCEKVKAMFDVEISVDWRVKPNESNDINTGIIQSE